MTYTNRKSVLAFLSVVFLAVFVAGVQAEPGSITRSLASSVVAPGGEVAVTLDVKIASGERYYIIDEIPPAGWTIQDKGSLIKDSNNHLKMVVLQNPVDKKYTYVLKAPNEEGSYSFSGIYQVDKMDAPAEIGGPSEITVSSATFDLSIAGIIGALAVAVLIAILYLKKSKKL